MRITAGQAALQGAWNFCSAHLAEISEHCRVRGGSYLRGSKTQQRKKQQSIRACCCVVDLLAPLARGRKITSPGQNSGRWQVSSVQEEQIFDTFFLAAMAVA